MLAAIAIASFVVVFGAVAVMFTYMVCLALDYKNL